MMFDLPSPDVLYTALVDRDAAYDGRAFVGVTTTGIFCRLTCPARKPLAKNCQWFASVTDCINAGFRPCKRCHPLGTATSDPAINSLLTALDARPDHRWSESDVTSLGHDPSTVRRAFKRAFGMTFLDMARQRRLSRGFTTLASGARVIDAQLDAGFDSPSAFRAAFARLLGQPPAAFTGDAMLLACWIDTPLGAMIAVTDNNALHLLEFADRKALPAELRKLGQMTKDRIGIGETAISTQTKSELTAFFAGQLRDFTVPLALHGSPFTRSVWHALRTIQPGVTRSYSQIAAQIGRPSATRAVARTNGANQIALIVPCHRVIGADGSLTGYGGGLWRKQKLIDLEQQYRTESTT